MIGKKSLAAIRQEVRTTFATAGIAPDQWFAEQIRKLERRPRANQREIDTLWQLRAALAEAAAPER